MKIVKNVLLILVGVIVLLLVIGLFSKKDYAVERSVVINKPKDQVFDYIKYLKNQNNYSKWALMDPNMKKTFSGTDGTVGFVSAWESDNKNVGKGEQEITKMAPDRVDYELRFKEPMENTDYAYMQTDAEAPTQTNVKWGFYGKMKYPMNVMLLFMNMDKMLGPDLETGLQNLKTIMEK